MKIEVKNVSKKFKEIQVINNINITFESGNIYGLCGRNGSGKSVFQKMLAGLYLPSSGTIFYDGLDLNKMGSYQFNLRALIEKPSFFPDLTGFQNLKLLAEIQNKIGDKEINDALEIVNLFEDRNKKYSKYSLGMKQKLGIAQVIMENPEIMILDEPFNGIERTTVEKIREYLSKKKQDGKLIIISTHINEDLYRLADYVYEFDNGKIREISNEYKN